MTLNGNGRIVGVASVVGILAVVVTIFIMLQTGLSGSVRDIMITDREQGERLTAVEVELDGVSEKVDYTNSELREMRNDIKVLLQRVE